MASNGTRPIGGQFGSLAARALLSGFVTWGSIYEMTRPSFDRMTVCIPRSKAPEVHPGVRYTIFTAKSTSRGWPFEFSLGTNMKGDVAPFPNRFWPLALACDLAFVGLLCVSAGNLLRGWRRKVALADLLAVTAALAVMMAFQVRAWGHALDLAKVAVDVGVFSAALTIIRCIRKCARGRLGTKGDDLRGAIRPARSQSTCPS